MPWVAYETDSPGRAAYVVAEEPDNGVITDVDRLSEQPPATLSAGEGRRKWQRTPRRRNRSQETPAWAHRS